MRSGASLLAIQQILHTRKENGERVRLYKMDQLILSDFSKRKMASLGKALSLP